jgi:DNA gyrase subunit A
MSAKHEDVVSHLFVASTHATVLFFTSSGRVFARKVYELPEVAPTGRGRALVNLLPIEADEVVSAVIAVRDFEPDEQEWYLLFATRAGRVKRTPLAAYANIRSSGLRAVSIEEGDDLLSVHLTNGSSTVFIGTRHGKAIRFEENDIRPMGRVSMGVRGIHLRDGDQVEQAATFDHADGGDILVVTDQGFGKRTPVEEFRLQGRGGYGVTLIRLTEKNGLVVGIRHVHDDDEILLITEHGMTIRMSVDEIRRTGRAAQGVHLIRMDEDDRVVAIARLVEHDDELEEEGTAAADGDTGGNGDGGTEEPPEPHL